MDWNEFHQIWDRFSRLPIKELSEDDENDERYNNTYNRHLVSIGTSLVHNSLEITIRRLMRGIDWYNSVNTNKFILTV